MEITIKRNRIVADQNCQTLYRLFHNYRKESKKKGCRCLYKKMGAPRAPRSGAESLHTEERPPRLTVPRESAVWRGARAGGETRLAFAKSQGWLPGWPPRAKVVRARRMHEVTSTSERIWLASRRSLGLAAALFVGFVGFANLLHALACGFWCDMLLGSHSRR